MSQKTEKPSLSGQRLKTRKRDEKEKYDPSAFRDAIIQGLNETGADLEQNRKTYDFETLPEASVIGALQSLYNHDPQMTMTYFMARSTNVAYPRSQVSKFLDVSGAKLDYRRYSDVLFDILFAGGQLAPGGSIVQDPDTTRVSRTDVCVFGCSDDRAELKKFFDVFNKLIRRYKYLERTFEDGIKKILVFLKGFTEEEQKKLAIELGIILANGNCKAQVLSCVFEDHLVKEGISLRFATYLFRSWLEEKDIGSVIKSLKAAQLDSRLLELFPLNKRSQEAFVNYFKKEGLEALAQYQGKQQVSEFKKELQKTLSEMITEEESIKEISSYLTEMMQKNGLQETEVVIYVWNTLMGQVEWNKKEELVAEQALKHLKKYAAILACVAKSPEAELKLLQKIQDYCYDNMTFMKVFQKIVVLLYKTDVLSEDCILKWHKEAYTSKGKSVFLEQMKPFVEWLQNAEEESEEDD